MSIKLMRVVWNYSQAEGRERLVLLVLADRAQDNGFTSPSVGVIAERAKVHPRTVDRALRRLIQMGEIEVIETGGGRQNAVYRILVSPACPHSSARNRATPS